MKKTILAGMALVLSLYSCTPGEGVTPDPSDPDDSTSIGCLYSYRYEVSADNE